MGAAPVERDALMSRIKNAILWLRLATDVSARFPVFGGAALLLACSVLSHAAEVQTSVTNADPSLILIVGAPGEPEFGTNFVGQVERWTATAARAKAKNSTIGLQT